MQEMKQLENSQWQTLLSLFAFQKRYCDAPNVFIGSIFNLHKDVFQRPFPDVHFYIT